MSRIYLQLPSLWRLVLLLGPASRVMHSVSNMCDAGQFFMVTIQYILITISHRLLFSLFFFFPFPIGSHLARLTWSEPNRGYSRIRGKEIGYAA